MAEVGRDLLEVIWSNLPAQRAGSPTADHVQVDGDATTSLVTGFTNPGQQTAALAEPSLTSPDDVQVN